MLFSPYKGKFYVLLKTKSHWKKIGIFSGLIEFVQFLLLLFCFAFESDTENYFWNSLPGTRSVLEVEGP